MASTCFNRRDFSLGLAAFCSAVGFAGRASAMPADKGTEVISHTAEAIHQEVTFKASRKRLYDALTDVKQFDQVVRLSSAGMSLGNAPTAISKDAGGNFLLFGGHIIGRHLELSPGERLVQAWRVVSWNPGIYSIVKFELSEQDGGAKLIFDHTGFPEGQGQHLADGWRANYWQPLEKYFAQTSG